MRQIDAQERPMAMSDFHNPRNSSVFRMMSQDLFHDAFAVFRIEFSERAVFDLDGLNQDAIEIKKMICGELTLLHRFRRLVTRMHPTRGRRIVAITRVHPLAT